MVWHLEIRWMGLEWGMMNSLVWIKQMCFTWMDT